MQGILSVLLKESVAGPGLTSLLADHLNHGIFAKLWLSSIPTALSPDLSGHLIWNYPVSGRGVVFDCSVVVLPHQGFLGVIVFDQFLSLCGVLVGETISGFKV